MRRLLVSIAVAAVGAAMLPASSRAGDDGGRFRFGGDMRGRFELFRFSQDETGSKKDTRGRIRYRLRFDGEVVLNDRANFEFRLVSGEDSRSGNETLGDPVDFGPNLVTIRRAAMVLTPWADGKLPDGRGYWRFDFGRVKNPFVWKGGGLDKMLWDNDIALAGTGTQFGHDLGETARVFFNAGYYVVDEASSGPDPYMTPAQAGIVFHGERARAGIRGSFWYFTELDSNFVHRGVDGNNGDGSSGVTSSGGNIQDGLTGNPYGGTLRVVSTQAFVSVNAGGTPLTAYGGYSQNLTAEASRAYDDVGRNETAYSAGVEGGDKKKVVKLGLAWFHIEANAFPSQFIDSDFLDGRTNREGLLFYLSKRVLSATDFNTQLFWSDAIETDSPAYEPSTKGSERVRLQVDLLYHF